MMLFLMAFFGLAQMTSSTLVQGTVSVNTPHGHHGSTMRMTEYSTALSSTKGTLTEAPLAAERLTSGILALASSDPLPNDTACISYCQATYELDEPSCHESLCSVFADLVTFGFSKSERRHRYTEFHYQAEPHLLLLSSLYRPPISPSA